MPVEIVTKDDLQMLRQQLMDDFKGLLNQHMRSTNGHIEGYKTSDVRKVLSCSVNKLVSLRIARKIRVKKIGGTLYYNKEDIKRLLEEGY